VILFYHLVSDRPLNHMALPLTDFAQQLEFLRRYYSVVSLEKAIERLRSGVNDEIVASITFDDGYRDNTWAIEYLRYFGIPATFFVSIGHVRDGSAFEHDHRRGFEDARPMSEDDLRRLVDGGFTIGSHGIHHEDFGALAPDASDRILRESRELIRDACGQAPLYFSFPKGHRGTNITASSYALAQRYFPYVFSAYGGYCFPQPGRRHFLRYGNPTNVGDLSMVMNGYTGFRACLTGNGWGLKTEALDPCSTTAAHRPAMEIGPKNLGLS
jgi:peptidoglycan/xylan/chitin deacetylase (PgdA/CDA1 family)